VELLHESILRGLTGTLTAGHADAAGHAIHLMQGEIVGAEGPDDDIWLVRRLTAQGAITERQGVAFTRSIERTGKLDAHLLDELPAPLHVALRAGRFRQNVLEFIRSPDPIRFERERTMFRDHAEVGHDSGALVRELAALREHVEGLQQQVHEGHRLRVGPAGPQDADQARLLDLVDPAMSLHDLITFSPFEEGRTLALVRDMLEVRALRSDQPIKLTAAPPGPDSSPDYSHAAESLFSAGSSVDDLVEVEVRGPARFDTVLGQLSAARQFVSGFSSLDGFAADAAEPGDWGDDVPGDYGGMATPPAPLVVEDVFDEALFEDLEREDVGPLAAPPEAAVGPGPKEPVAAPPTPQPADAHASAPTSAVELEAVPSLQQLMAQAAKDADPDPDASARALIEPPSLQSPATPAPTIAPVREEALVEETPSEDLPSLGDDLADALADAAAAVGVAAADDATAPIRRPRRPDPRPSEDLFDLGEDLPGVDDFEDAHTEEVPRSSAPVHDLRAASLQPLAPSSGAASPPREPSLSEQPTADTPTVTREIPAQMVETLFDDGFSVAPASIEADPPDTIEADPLDTIEAEALGAIEAEPLDAFEALEADALDTIEAAPIAFEALEAAPIAFEALEAEPLDALEAEPLDALEAEPLDALEAEPLDALDALDAEPLDALEAEPLDALDAEPLDALEAEPLDALEAARGAEFGENDSTEDMFVDDGEAPSPAVAAALRRAEEDVARRETARRNAEYDDDDLLVSHPPRTDLFDFGDDVDDGEMAMFRDHDRFRGAGQGQFTLSHKLLDVVDLDGGGSESGNLPPPVEFPAGFGTPRMAEDGDDDGMLEMGDAESASLTDADKVVALNFSAPTLELAEMDKKLRVATDVLSRISGALDTKLGPGAGQASVQLLLDGAPSAYAVVFQGLEARLDGTFDVSSAARNIRRRPPGEHRRLIDNGTMDLIERGLSYAVAELDDDAMDALLESIAGYQQRLRS
jgi:hypothetical protein